MRKGTPTINLARSIRELHQLEDNKEGVDGIQGAIRTCIMCSRLGIIARACVAALMAVRWRFIYTGPAVDSNDSLSRLKGTCTLTGVRYCSVGVGSAIYFYWRRVYRASLVTF